jgi:hypothetical protein
MATQRESGGLVGAGLVESQERRPGNAERGGTRTPLWAALAFSFASSFGTGLVTNGIYFLSKYSYGFHDGENYLLGLMQGVAYVAGAIGTGLVVRRVRAATGVSTRVLLAVVLGALAAACFVPILALTLSSQTGADASTEPIRAKWPVWLLVAVYSPLTGALWPIAESFLSGGRSGPTLRSALGRFNITWSSALVLGMWALGPLVKEHAAAAIAGIGSIHLLSLAMLPWLGREPGRHEHEEHEPHPPIYNQLLVTFRILLPSSYVVLTALTPFLPTILTKLGVAIAWSTPLAATWTASRVVTFFAMERWHGWQGRWYPALWAMGLLLGGFAVTVLSPALGSGNGAIAVMLIGLAGFGVGMAVIYTAALYYAMEVGKAEVDAGGKHEALIGLGYTGGPLCGLIAGLVVPYATESFSSVVLALVAIVALSAGGVAAWRAWAFRQT